MLKKAKDFIMKKAMDRQLKDASPEERQLIEILMKKDPELLKKINKEIKAEMKGGKDQMSAAMKVMPKYQSQLQALMGGQAVQQRGAPRFNPKGNIHR